MFIIDITPILVIVSIALFYCAKFLWILNTTAWKEIRNDWRD